MNLESTVDKFGAFVASQARSQKELRDTLVSRFVGPAVTISHQAGSGAHEIANQLAKILLEDEPKGARPWTVLDRQIVEKALEEHHWPSKLANRMSENKRSYVNDVMDDLFGLRPPSWVLVPQVVETMLHLAEAGRVILIGRGATVVTARLPNMFHVRLVASLATRVRKVQQSRGLSAKEATQFVEKEDLGRQRYVKANFRVRLENELLYHMVINTDLLQPADAARVIAEGARRCFKVRARDSN